MQRKKFEYDSKEFKDLDKNIRSGENRDTDLIRRSGQYVKGKSSAMLYGNLPELEQPLEVRADKSLINLRDKEKDLERFDSEIIKDEINFVKNNLPEKFLGYYYTDEQDSNKLRSVRDALKGTSKIAKWT